MKTINIYEAKTRLSQMIAEVEKGGDPIVLCRNGKPVATWCGISEGGVQMEPAPDLLGGSYLKDPSAGVSLEDWPEEHR